MDVNPNDNAHAVRDASAIVLDVPVRLRFGDVMDVPLPLLVILKGGEVSVPSDTYRFALNEAVVERFEALHCMLTAICSLYRGTGHAFRAGVVNRINLIMIELRMSGARSIELN